MLIGKNYKIEKVNMEGLKPPYLMLSNHMYFIDFELAAMGTWPYRVNNVVSIDGYYRRPWLMELIGAICTRKFTMDLHLIKSIYKVLRRGDILSMYPEARYSPAGVTSYLPDSLGKLIKRSNVPVVAVIHHGNHLHSPFWNFRNKRKAPLHTVFTQILSAEEVASKTPDEIMDILRKAFIYDDYKYQKDNGILIKEEFRAEGLHKILYQCPNCLTEHKMNSKGSTLFCENCKKEWVWREDGYLEAVSGDTEFDHIPDWFEWEREQVRAQVLDGTYCFEDEVDIYSMPRCWRFEHLGNGRLVHSVENGFRLEGFYNDMPFEIKRSPLQTNSLHIEYDYCYIKPFDCVDISTENDSFYCYPKKENVVTKLAFATEEIYQLHQKNKR